VFVRVHLLCFYLNRSAGYDYQSSKTGATASTVHAGHWPVKAMTQTRASDYPHLAPDKFHRAGHALTTVINLLSSGL